MADFVLAGVEGYISSGEVDMLDADYGRQ